MGFRKFGQLAACLVISLILSAHAHADTNTAKAKQLYDEGVTNYNLGHYDEALTAFEMAYRVKHDPAFLFNIAQCQRQLRRYDDAQRSYRAYLRESPGLPDSTREQVQKLSSEMERALEEQRSKQPLTGTQPPGATQSIEAPATKEAEQTATTTSQPAAQPLPSPSDQMPRSRARLERGLGIGLLVVGVALVGAGAGLAVYSSSLYSQAKNATVLGDQRDLKSRSDLMNDAGWPLVGVGSAAVVGGTVALVLSFRGGRSETRAMVQR